MAPAILKAICTGFGSGLSPVMPGTAGSLAALAVWYLLTVNLPIDPALTSLSLVILTVPIGILATNSYLRSSSLDTSDPQEVVIDEWAGLYLTLALTSPNRTGEILIGFLLFRVFDMTKPGPIRVLERLPGSWGVMADDIAAGACSLLTLKLILLLYP